MIGNRPRKHLRAATRKLKVSRNLPSTGSEPLLGRPSRDTTFVAVEFKWHRPTRGFIAVSTDIVAKAGGYAAAVGGTKVGGYGGDFPPRPFGGEMSR